MGWGKSELPGDGGEVQDAKCPEARFFSYRLKFHGGNLTGASRRIEQHLHLGGFAIQFYASHQIVIFFLLV